MFFLTHLAIAAGNIRPIPITAEQPSMALTSPGWFLIWMIQAIVGFAMGSAKGKGLIGFLLALLFGPLGLVVILLMPTPKTPESEAQARARTEAEVRARIETEERIRAEVRAQIEAEERAKRGQ